MALRIAAMILFAQVISSCASGTHRRQHFPSQVSGKYAMTDFETLGLQQLSELRSKKLNHFFKKIARTLKKMKVLLKYFNKEYLEFGWPAQKRLDIVRRVMRELFKTLKKLLKKLARLIGR
eukprot:TRINITY_DN11302_c0_g2_i1.p1 TRINITY_DN11302_c0_g2~~TRINITY_DN11302_c0_g2_i1.p1  ORF type:complete len:121 (-),score=18.28 TRINITY_DN11302_c0_g2_i1:6-368(-)